MKNINYLIGILLLSGCTVIQPRNKEDWVSYEKQLHPAGEVLCVPPYNPSDNNRSSGKVNLKISNQLDIIIIRIVSENLLPDNNYTIFFMQGEKPWESMGCDYGPWKKIGSFNTNGNGKGIFQIRIPNLAFSSIQDYISIWINDTDMSSTILVSNSFNIELGLLKNAYKN